MLQHREPLDGAKGSERTDEYISEQQAELSRESRLCRERTLQRESVKYTREALSVRVE